MEDSLSHLTTHNLQDTLIDDLLKLQRTSNDQVSYTFREVGIHLSH
jgi:hypothetical protein